LFLETQDMRSETQDAPGKARRIIETVHIGQIRYQLERVRCGKQRCQRCAEGDGHGPYWYAYERRQGRTVRSYHGCEVPQQVAEARRRDHAMRLRARALEHDAVMDIVMAVEDLGALLCQADEHDLEDTTADELTADELAALDELSDELEYAADELRDITRNAVRKVRRRITRRRRLVAEAEELLP